MSKETTITLTPKGIMVNAIGYTDESVDLCENIQTALAKWIGEDKAIINVDGRLKFVSLKKDTNE